MDLLVRDWSSLPEHLLDSVLERVLLPDDYLRFSSVCTSWHSVAQDNKAKRVRMTAPLLLFYTGRRSTWGLYDVTDNIVLSRQVRLPNHRFCGSSPTGWLVSIDKYFQVILVNPFLRVKGSIKKDNSIVHLPHLFGGPPCLFDKNRMSGLFFYKALVSGDPLLNPNNCVVVVIMEPHMELAFFRVGIDSEWNFINHDDDFPIPTEYGMIQDIIYFEDKFYALDQWNNLFSFKVAAPSVSDVQVVVKGNMVDVNQLQDDDICDFKYIVKVNEKDIIMVHRYTDDEIYNVRVKHYKRKTIRFKLFKLSYDNSEWVQIYDLGEIALFVGDNSSVCVLGLEWSGCQPNCIYFTHGWNRVRIDSMQDGHHDFGVYDVKTQTLSETCGSVAKNLVRLMKRPPLWVMPPPVEL